MKKLILILAIFTSSLFANTLSTYLYSDMKSVDSIKSNLQRVGFNVIASYDSMQNSDYKVVVYTSSLLQRLASKENRGFIAVQKVLIDKVNNKLVFTNPKYYAKAMLQNDYDNSLVNQVSNRLKAAFTMSKSEYALGEDDLSSYHFMFGMPYYEDMITVASGDNLNNKLKSNASSNIVFEVKLNNATLYGVSMNVANGEKDYMTTLKQESSSAFLPYMVIVQNNEAKILHPKYYLALSLPKLTMGEFMAIMDTPGHIEDYFKNLFK